MLDGLSRFFFASRGSAFKRRYRHLRCIAFEDVTCSSGCEIIESYFIFGINAPRLAVTEYKISLFDAFRGCINHHHYSEKASLRAFAFSDTQLSFYVIYFAAMAHDNRLRRALSPHLHTLSSI